MTVSIVQAGCIAGALVVAGGLGWWTLDRGVVADIETLEQDITKAEARIEFREKQAATLKRDEGTVQDIATRTIAGSPEKGVHTLRLALTALAEAAGLRDVSVTSRHAGGAVNPGSRELSVLKGLKEVRDFDVIAGSLSGRGDVDQVVRTLALLDTQPWPRRTGRVSLTPEEGGSVIRLAIDVETIVLADLPPEEFTPEPTPLDAEREALITRLASRNVFAPPPPPSKPEPKPDPPKPEPTRKPTPKPPQAPPYADWRVSGVVEVGSVAELWLTHANSGQTLLLTQGESHLDAVFAGVQDGMAIISIGGDRYALALGETLASRDRPMPSQ